jgi:hypothetical protein
MKHKHFLLALLISGLSIFSIYAQEAEETPSKFSVGADFYSNYIWRGTKFGVGPAFQPTVKFVTGGFTLGAWGSFDASGYQEADLFTSYTFPVGLSIGLTDYYYPNLGNYFEVSDTAGTHAFEVNLGFTKGGLTLSANYILNEAAGAASMGGDKYFQVTYAFKTFNVFVGAGDGWHTKDPDKFAICNVGLGTSKTIKITDTFSIPVTGQVVLNPDKEQLFLVVGFSL